MDEKGLYNKYIVFDNRTGEPVSRRCFVLIPDPEKDPVAIDAIEEYARKTENRTLASDLFQWAARLRAIGEIRAAEEVVEYGADKEYLC